ncbi:TOG array regulator of axonemal microtubules protein 2-like [Passer domesticus]|uniref:TOG array regulator of axonemal microtubules protein 2-like n=1 Tax=Passer domesticus TaxID=48849 RepID=UPI0030FEA0DA
MERVRRAVRSAFSLAASRKAFLHLAARLRGGRSQARASVPLGEDLASQDSWAQAGKAEGQESTDGVHGAQEFRWKELAAFERKRHSSLERVSEVAAATAEEWQPQRDLLKEAVPLAVPKVFRRQRPAHRGLEKLLQEFSCQGHTLSQVCREKAVMAQENAALEARLAATERDLRGLSEQLAEARCLSDRETKRYKQKGKDTEQLLFIFTPCRSEKESLQSSLLEAQQHIWELEMARSRVEAQVCRARQAKEAILEDVRGLRRELLAVRALSQQRCEDMAEQLRWAQEQCCKALRLWQSAQEEEKTNLMQELERQLEEQHVEAWKQLEERANFLAETSLLCSTGGEMKKGQLGKSLIPRLCKAGIPPVGSAAGSVHSSPKMELQESQEMRARPSSRSQEKTPEHASLSLSQAKETDHPSSPGLRSDKERRDSFGKTHAELCRLAKENLELKKMEILMEEMKRRQNEKSLQLPPETFEPGDAAEASFSLPPINGTVSSVQRKDPGSAMKKTVVRKQDTVPLQPSTPTLPGDGSFPRSSSETSQTATGAQCQEEPLRGHRQKDRAFSDPQQALQEALSLLGSDDWEQKKKGLLNITLLAESHSEVLLCRLREICLAVTSEVTNLRSNVSCSAIVTLGELFAILGKDMDSEVDQIAAVLLHMLRNSPEFIQKAACQSLGMMVENVTPTRAMTALMDNGVKSRYVPARKCTAELLLSLMEKMGVTKLAGTPRAERLAQVAGTLAQDSHKDTRHYGQEMVKMLLSNQKFKKLLEQSLSTHDLEDILKRIKKKEYCPAVKPCGAGRSLGMENNKAELPPVQEPVKKRNDGSQKPQATSPPSKRAKSATGGRRLHRARAQVTLPASVEERELLQKLYHLLEAKAFQTRMEGVALLLDLSKTRPQLISTNIVQIFDYFGLRICDTHKKVKQKALEALAEIIGLLQDAMNPLMIRLVEGITKNLNSKDPGVHAAAMTALDQSVVHLDEVSLMKELCHQWRRLSGQALLDVTERITVLVEWAHARSPEAVERYALPVLWSCLENKALPVRSANVCAVVTKLACALCEALGSQIIKFADSTPPHVQENLNSLLGW